MQVLANNSLHHYYQKLSQVGRRDTADFKLVLCTSIYIKHPDTTYSTVSGCIYPPFRYNTERSTSAGFIISQESAPT